MPIEPGNLSLGVLAGGIIGTVCTHYLSKSRSAEERHIREFNDAATRFRAAFKDEFLALNPSLAKGSPDACELLTAAFEKHRSAVFDFKPFLSRSAKRFEQAWQEYYRYTNAPDWTVPIFSQYSGKTCDESEAKKRKALAAERIERLLSFAHNR